MRCFKNFISSHLDGKLINIPRLRDCPGNEIEADHKFQKTRNCLLFYLHLYSNRLKRVVLM